MLNADDELVRVVVTARPGVEPGRVEPAGGQEDLERHVAVARLEDAHAVEVLVQP